MGTAHRAEGVEQRVETEVGKPMGDRLARMKVDE